MNTPAVSPSAWWLVLPTASERGNAVMGGVWLTIAAACGLTAALFGARQFFSVAPALRREETSAVNPSRPSRRDPSRINGGSNARVKEMLRREGSS